MTVSDKRGTRMPKRKLPKSPRSSIAAPRPLGPQFGGCPEAEIRRVVTGIINFLNREFAESSVLASHAKLIQYNTRILRHKICGETFVPVNLC